MILIDVEKDYQIFTTPDQYDGFRFNELGEKHMNTCKGCSACEEHGLDAESLGRELEGE